MGPGTALHDFGHFLPGVPETPHIGAHPRALATAGAGWVVCNSPANWLVPARKSPEAGVIAMQKVVGSNPISRFERDLALGRDFVVRQKANGKSNHSRISPPFWAVVPK